MILEVNNLQVNYGAIKAVKGISFYVNEGEIVTLIGANGAGKTTTLRAISGLERVHTGTVKFKGEDITNIAPHKIVGMGLTHVPEGRRIFTNLTVMENLRMAALLVKDKGEISKSFDEVFELFPRLKERRTQSTLTLSGGEQQMLAVGRAIVTGGDLVVLDEPSMGLAPMIVDEIFNVILRLNKEGATILLNEQNAYMALSIADRAYVLETGNITLEGTGKDLLDNPAVQDAYLGS
ncbi:MAG: ABC transporter ATP-binding protein [Chloroflexi bacterium]|jgi:branched-chain amino acid transport system ATP-binding protein|nr:ABC transporter ATP-binding protein [Chloroflexota bacterium]